MANINPYESPPAKPALGEPFTPELLPITVYPSEIQRIISATTPVLMGFAFCTQLNAAVMIGDMFTIACSVVSLGSFLAALWAWRQASRSQIEISSSGIKSGWPRAVVAWTDVASWRQGWYTITVVLKNGDRVRLKGPVAESSRRDLVASALKHFVNAG